MLGLEEVCVDTGVLESGRRRCTAFGANFLPDLPDCTGEQPNTHPGGVWWLTDNRAPQGRHDYSRACSLSVKSRESKILTET